MMLTHLKDQICPYCARKLNTATSVDSSPQKAETGDISLCFHCGELCTFDESMNFRKMTPEELKIAEGLLSPDVIRIQRQRKQLYKETRYLN